jgi:hypothetical protein
LGRTRSNGQISLVPLVYFPVNSEFFAFASGSEGNHYRFMVPADGIQKKIFWRVFLCLWGLGSGLRIVALWLTSPTKAMLARQLWIPLHTQSMALIVLAAVVQAFVGLAIVTGVGLVAARQIGLGAPVLEAWFRHQPIRPLVKAPLLPILLTMLLYSGCTLLANSSWLHPNRKQDATFATQLANSPMADKANKELEQLGLVGTKRLTFASLIISDLAGEVGGEIDRRLFEVSVIALLLVQIFRNLKTIPSKRLLWAAILIVALISTLEAVAVERGNTLSVISILQSSGIPDRVIPIWLATLRSGLRIFPTSIAIGLIYVNYGIESSIVANISSALAANFFLLFWMTHFA